VPIANAGNRQPESASKLEEIRQTAVHRLEEIEPLIEEAQRLRSVLSAIEQEPLTLEEPPTSNGNGNAHPPSESSRAPKGANKRIILELVAERPGITSAEIAQLTGVKRTVVASTVSRLKRHGELEEHGVGGVRVAAAQAKSA
jgi:predicted HTH transcriptional regulator